jgi:hypothetical protein
VNRFVSEIIDKYVLHNIHKEKSETGQFKGVPNNIFGAEKLFKNPTMPKIDFTQIESLCNYDYGHYSYKSEMTSMHGCNNCSVGEFYLNKSQEENLSIILVHGWRSSFSRVKKIFSNHFMESGYDMYYFTLPYHLERNPKEAFNGEYYISADIERTVEAVKQGVSDLRALIHWIKNNKKGKIALLGISLGGHLVNLTGVVENEIDILISIFYANDIAYTIWNAMPGKHMKKEFTDSGMTYENLFNNWNIIDPSNYKPYVDKDNIYLLSGKYDLFIPPCDSNKLWEKWDKPERKLYNSGHSGLKFYSKSICNEITSFIEKRYMSI